MTPLPGPRHCPATKRFAPRYDTLALLAVVRAVSSFAAAGAEPPKGPLAITQDEYDEARAAAGFATSKRAFRICMQLEAPWAKVLETAYLDGRSFIQTVAALPVKSRTLLTEGEVRDALRAIAQRLAAHTLRPHEYDTELALLVLEQSRAWLHGKAVGALPSSSRIDAQFGWDAALELAGLGPRPAPGRPMQVNASGGWTLARCVESLMAALGEAGVVAPRRKLTQPLYRTLADGRADLAPMSSITYCARSHGTTFSTIRDSLIAWRASGAKGEPDILVDARAIDGLPNEERPATQRVRQRAAQRRADRIESEVGNELWAAELLAVLDEIGEPAAMKHVLAHTRWARNKTLRRMRKLEEVGLVERINHGTSRRTVLWRPRASGLPSGPAA